GTVGSRCESLSGFYNVLAKEQDHVSTAERISLPWSIQFSGNYFIHGFPEYADHTRVTAPSMSDCIRMATDDAKKAYDFADSGTPLFVYDPPPSTPMPSLVLGDIPVPHVSAASYLVADMDTNEVFLEQHAQDPHAIASVTKLMTALVANETIPSGENVDIPRSELLPAQKNVSAMQETFFAGDLLYPLLMQANAAVADSLAEHYGTNDFVAWMNTTAERLGMQSTHFADASGASAEDRSAPDDLYRLATYIADRDSFVLAMLRTPNKKLIAASGNAYSLSNANIFSDSATLIGGKASKTATTTDTMVSLFSMPLNNETRRVAIIVLASNDATADTTALADWVAQSVQQGALMAATACVSCVTAPQYRKIQW
ncbi:MAG: hypothetical protein KGI71_03820, partial [Patescibacteria group bacterium]|nr:hypothetical protein [Patescibacteria group bacterium]